MTLTISRLSACAGTESDRPHPRPIWPLLVAGWLLQAGIRLLLAGGQGVPVALPDESGYLIAARWLAGGPGADLSGSTFYQGGYPLLITPAFWLSHDPQTCYRLAVGIGAFAAAAVFPLGHLALRRLGLGRAPAYTLGFAAALLPAATEFGTFALTDAILPAVVLGWLLTLHTFLRDADVRSGVAAGLTASFAYAVHSRGTVILAVQVVVLAGVLLGRVVDRRAALVSAAGTLAGTGAAWALNSALRAALYPEGVRDLGGILASRLTTTAGLQWTWFGATGQIWYLIVGTWGLAGLGLTVVAGTLIRRGTPVVPRIMAGVLLATTLGIAVASSAALPDEHRVGNYAYGRYLTCVAVAYGLAGLAVLARRRAMFTRALVAAVIAVGCALAVTVYAGERLTTSKFIAFDFPETCLLTWDWTSLRLGMATAMAFALLGLLVLVALTPRPAATIAVTVAAFSLFAVTVSARPWGPDRVAIFQPGQAGGGVAVAKSVSWRVWVRQAYQVWWTPITFFDPARDRPRAGVCMVVVSWPAESSPEASWPGRPAGWRVMTERQVPEPWVAWRDDHCHRTVT